jgi:hypothetical protein
MGGIFDGGVLRLDTCSTDRKKKNALITHNTCSVLPLTLQGRFHDDDDDGDIVER